MTNKQIINSLNQDIDCPKTLTENQLHISNTQHDIGPFKEMQRSQENIEKIQQMADFQHLDLQDIDIKKNWERLQKVLKSKHECGSESFCCKADGHDSLERLEDGNICEQKYICKKDKCLEKIEDQDLDDLISKNIINPEFVFSGKQVKQCIKYWTQPNTSTSIKDKIANIGKADYQLADYWIENKDKNQTRALAACFALASALKLTRTYIISAQHFKNTLLGTALSYKSKDPDQQEIIDFEYKKITKVKTLIIQNICSEHGAHVSWYFLELFFDLLNLRKKNNLTTICLCNLSWRHIESSIKRCPKFKVKEHADMQRLRDFADIAKNRRLK